MSSARIESGTDRQGCQMFEKEYGKCLPSLWQIFDENNFENGKCYWQHRFFKASDFCKPIFTHVSFFKV